jgi:8-oxo-dGTP pyrophosphatase MutT (NUDIX family)
VSATLDKILEATRRLADVPCAWVLFVHPEEKVSWARDPATPWKKILLRRHAPELWGLPGGPISDGEAAEDAAQRWAEAQTGMSCGTFSEVFDVAGGRVFVAPVLGRNPLELLQACNAERFGLATTR